MKSQPTALLRRIRRLFAPSGERGKWDEAEYCDFGGPDERTIIEVRLFGFFPTGADIPELTVFVPCDREESATIRDRRGEEIAKISQDPKDRTIEALLALARDEAFRAASQKLMDACAQFGAMEMELRDGKLVAITPDRPEPEPTESWWE